MSRSRNWAVVWTYYVTYHATQALAVANGQLRPTSHPATQQLFAEQWLGRKSRLAPWSMAVDHAGAVNLPPSCSVSKIHPWSTCGPDTCWSLLATALKTTRDDTVGERVRLERTRQQSAKKKAWHQEESDRRVSGKRARKVPAFSLPRLSVTEKAAVGSKVRPTTLIDYLYRLRIRSNYVDTEMFTDGPERPYDSTRVHRSLRLITSTTLLLYEMHIGALLGKKVFAPIVDEWLAGHVYPQHTMALASRRAVLFS